MNQDNLEYERVTIGSQTRWKLTAESYAQELRRLQIELVKLQEWIRHAGLKMVIICEGRDAAGRGSMIKSITQYLNPRICRVEALDKPTEKENTQWYFQRYVCLLYTSPSPRDRG